MNEQMRLLTDLEFQQREIIKLNEKYNVLMFITKVRDRRVFAAEQKIREFKKLLLKSKRLHKGTTSLHLETRQLTHRAVNNTNKITSQKYGFTPDFVGEKTLNDKKFCGIYDFHSLVKARKHAER